MHTCEQRVHVWDKLDGSNIRAEWNKKRGFYKFGSRYRLIDSDSGILTKAPSLIMKKYADELDSCFRAQRWDSVIAFFEFFGQSSFAGQHNPDEEHDVMLLDVSTRQQGMLESDDFIKLFHWMGIPKLLNVRPFTQKICDQVSNGTLTEMTFEGVVCKGAKQKKTGLPLMFKQKNKSWIAALKRMCKNDIQRYKMLL